MNTTSDYPAAFDLTANEFAHAIHVGRVRVAGTHYMLQNLYRLPNGTLAVYGEAFIDHAAAEADDLAAANAYHNSR